MVQRNVCSNCRLYNLDGISCEKCGAPLIPFKDVDSTYNNAEGSIPITPTTPPPSAPSYPYDEGNRYGVDDASVHRSALAKSTKKIFVMGTIQGYSKREEYRNIFRKIGDSICYGQVKSDFANTFSVIKEGTHESYPVVAYGLVSARGGQIQNGTYVEVKGKMNSDGVIVATLIRTENRNVRLECERRKCSIGNRSHRGMTGIMPVIVIGLILLAILAYWLFPDVRVFLGFWCSTALIAELLFLFVRPLNVLASKLYVAIGLGLLITLILYNTGGIATILGSVMYALGPIAITIAGMIILIKSVFKR